MSEYVCKHCGGDDIVAEIEVRRSEVPVRIRQAGGKPRCDLDLGYAFDDGYDVLEYLCACGKGSFKLEELVIERQAFDQLRLPCGRCDHNTTDHELLSGRVDAPFLRQRMPCTVEGCDCHDYYDVAISFAPRPGQMEMAA